MRKLKEGYKIKINKKRRKRRKKRIIFKIGPKSFTLLELLIVIAIIGILATMITVSLASAKGKARDAQRKSDVAGISKAFEAYFAEYGYYPQLYDINSHPGGVKSTEGYYPVSFSPYFSVFPKDPLNTMSPGPEYYYNLRVYGSYQYCIIAVNLESGGSFYRSEKGSGNAGPQAYSCGPDWPSAFGPPS
jgi:prepilin-type N-terminal cleavage/methylation domain-containing protein